MVCTVYTVLFYEFVILTNEYACFFIITRFLFWYYLPSRLIMDPLMATPLLVLQFFLPCYWWCTCCFKNWYSNTANLKSLNWMVIILISWCSLPVFVLMSIIVNMCSFLEVNLSRVVAILKYRKYGSICWIIMNSS